MKSLIAEALETRMIRNKHDGYCRGEGCPFHPDDFDCNECCGVIFPSMITMQFTSYGNYKTCPCLKFSKKYVIKRCDLFRNKHLTND